MSTGGTEAPAPVQPPPPGEPWTVLHLVRWSSAWLGERGVERPRLDVELMLADALGFERLRLYLEFDRPLVETELAAFRARLRRRAAREPLQYILGRTGFRELQLRTDARALVPRPETEELVGAILAWAGERGGDRSLSAVDVGTGTGAIALSLAVEGPFRTRVATDISSDALALAMENAAGTALPEGTGLEFREGSLFSPLRPGERFDVVVSNPPYVSEAEWAALQPEVRDWEPKLALTAGNTGLDLLEALVDQASHHLMPGGLLALELGVDQARIVVERIRERGEFADPRILKDLSGRDRMILAVLRNGDVRGGQ